MFLQCQSPETPALVKQETLEGAPRNPRLLTVPPHDQHAAKAEGQRLLTPPSVPGRRGAALTLNTRNVTAHAPTGPRPRQGHKHELPLQKDGVKKLRKPEHFSNNVNNRILKSKEANWQER